MRFVAIDVETANSNMASICSIGAAEFENGALTSEWYSLIDPQDYFDARNIAVHGIDETHVADAPTFKDSALIIKRLLTGVVVVTHTHFDRVAMHQAAQHWSIPPINCTWLDSARVARRTWAECAKRGYGLADVCKLIGYTFQHHHALEDAKASGEILLAAMRESDLDLDGMLRRVSQPIVPAAAKYPASVKRDGNPDGFLWGDVVVFTGALQISRQTAADLAASAGCAVAASVTKKTTLLVVGDVDAEQLADHNKSSKHRKAEQMAAKGSQIRVISETDFMELVEQKNSCNSWWPKKLQQPWFS